jgi:hypothetical protein
LDRVLDSLREVGDLLAERVSDCPDERAAVALANWERRNVSDPDRLVSLATGIRSDELSAIQGVTPAERFWNLKREPAPDNALLAAARMSASFGPPIVTRVVEAVRSVPPAPVSRVLGQASFDALRILEEVAAFPAFEQGQALAGWLRSQPGVCTTTGRARIDELLAAWRVHVHEVILPTGAIDAVACWSVDHGATISLNVQGRHAASAGGRRATLAHEVAHLLLDRDAALPLVDVLGGQVSREAEARANAFAAELLLPRADASREMGRLDSTPETNLRRIQAAYGVSAEVIAWQARNAEHRHFGPDVLEYLRRFVSHPERF